MTYANGGAQVVLVVGASSGIGRATAHGYAARGAHLVLASRSPEALADAAQECLDRGAASATVEVVDVADGPAVTAVVERVVAQHGRIDVCVQSAALIAFGEFLDVPAEVFDRVVTSNVLGTANVARAVLPGMRDRNSGVLVVIGSVLGRISVPQLITYCTSKWAVRGLTRMLSQSVRDRSGVRVVGVSPGATNTPVYAQAANVTGRAARPPVPVDPPEKVARAVLRAADSRRRGETSVGIANPVMVLGHELLPPVFDLLVGPLMGLLALTRRPMEPHSGNVETPSPTGESTQGPWSRGGLLGLDTRDGD